MSAQDVAVPAVLRSVHGGELDLGKLEHELDGPEGAPLVVLLGGISSDAHPVATTRNPTPGWWQSLLDSAALPIGEYRTLGFRFLEVTGAPTDTRDQADALARLLDQLDIGRVHAVIGASYGGMVGLAFAARHKERLGRLVMIGAAHRSHPLATAGRLLQRRVVRLGIETGRERDALELARGIAITSYRSALEFEERFGALPVVHEGDVHCEVDRYLRHQGSRFAAGYTSQRYLALSESIDLHAIDPCEVSVPTTLIALDTDTLVPPADIESLARQLPDAQYHLVSTRYGHDGFLKDADLIAPHISASLRDHHND